MMTSIDEKMAGEITMAVRPGERIRKWRAVFKITQTDVARHMGIASSVISDYEKGRRSPGSGFVRDMVNAMVEIDTERGGSVVKRFTPPGHDGILGMGEFAQAVPVEELVEAVDGKMLRVANTERNIFGYTMIDSLKAVTSMKSFDYLRIYGWSTERALFFTGIRFGRSPMVAIRASPLTPAMVVYVQPEEVDTLTLKLAEVEDTSLMRTDMETDEIMRSLNEL